MSESACEWECVNVNTNESECMHKVMNGVAIWQNDVGLYLILSYQRGASVSSYVSDFIIQLVTILLINIIFSYYIHKFLC